MQVRMREGRRPVPDDFAGLLAGVLAAPPDPHPKLVLGDWLEENGDLPRAEGMRLAAKRGWRPSRSDRDRFFWRRIRRDNYRDPCDLPKWLFHLLPGGLEYDERYFPTPAAAWDAYLLAFCEAVRLGRWPRPTAQEKWDAREAKLREAMRKDVETYLKIVKGER